MNVPAELRLLLIEDMEDDAALLLLELQRAGWDVTYRRVETAAAMIAAIHSDPWDIIISDYSLPQFSGVAALGIAREHASDLPFILVSGTVGEDIAVQAMRAGAGDYLFKGNLRRLVPAVRRELRDAESRRNARRFEQELHLRERQLTEARRLARVGSWLIDFTEDVVHRSDEADQIFQGKPHGQKRSVSAFLAHLHPEDRALIDASITDPGVAHFERDCASATPDAPVRFVHIRGDIVRDAGGKPRTASGTVQDITERKSAEQKLRAAYDELAIAKQRADAANRAKDEFLAVLSHELRTPLTPVLLTVSLLEHNTDIPQDVREDIKTIRSHVELEARLIDDLLDLTRIQHGKLNLNPEIASAHLLLRNASELCCFGRASDVTMALNAKHHYIRADPARVQQIFWNLLSNAVKFTPRGRPITVTSTNPDEATIQIQVADQGVGIEPDVLPRVFNAFEQGDSTRTRKFDGLGLGLTIAKSLVESHGGRIKVESAGRNLGARLTVELPTAPIAPVRPSRFPPAATPAPEWAERQVLLVEDHPETRAIMIKLLRKLGHNVRAATCVKEALALAQDHAIDFLVSDIGLPDGSGHDVMRALRDRGVTNGIAISGYGTEEDVQASLEAGFARHLVKPIDLSRLQIAIQQLLTEV